MEAAEAEPTVLLPGEGEPMGRKKELGGSSSSGLGVESSLSARSLKNPSTSRSGPE